MRFPAEVGELGGLTFEEAFVRCPKIIEFVHSLWTDQCTGIFKDFRDFVKNALSDSAKLKAHKQRCRSYVKGLVTGTELAPYLVKYADAK